MIMPKSSDLLHHGCCADSRLRWVHADVSDSARALCQSHLCGPAASLVLAETLCGVALLGGELTQPEETVTLSLRVSGPVGGVLAECAFDGGLRGYTQRKLLDDLDGSEEPASAAAFGESATVSMIRSLPGRILAHAGVDVRPASAQLAVERLFAHSLQRHARVLIVALAYEGSIDLVRGLLVECLPDGDRAAFEALGRRLDDGSALEALEAAPSAAALCEELGLDAPRPAPPRPLRFACRCSPGRAESSLAALSTAELAAMAAGERPADVHCNLCGRHFAVAPARLRSLLTARRAEPGGS